MARRAVLAAALACAAAILLGFGGGKAFALDALAHFRLHLAAIALAVAGVAAIWRRDLALGVAACAALGFAGLGPALESPARPAAGETFGLTVALSNVDIANPAPRDAQAALSALPADVLVTLESHNDFREPDGPLSRRFPHVVNRVEWIYTGAWLWSAGAPASGARIDNEPDRLAAVWARFETADGPFTVLGLHLRRPLTESQESQIAGLAAVLPPLEPPLVVVGDFNAAPWSEAVARVAAALGVEPVGGLRMTWRSKLAGWLGPLAPLASLPIDHALVSPGVGVEAVEVFDVPGSDHRGLLLRLQIPRRSAPTASDTLE